LLLLLLLRSVLMEKVSPQMMLAETWIADPYAHILQQAQRNTK
jgi:hypothetical protein